LSAAEDNGKFRQMHCHLPLVFSANFFAAGADDSPLSGESTTLATLPVGVQLPLSETHSSQAVSRQYNMLSSQLLT